MSGDAPAQWQKLLRLRKLALEIVELTQDLEQAAPKPSAEPTEPTLEDYIALRARRRRRAHRG